MAHRTSENVQQIIEAKPISSVIPFMTTSSIGPSLLKDPEAALRLGISPSTLRSWRCRGIGPSYVKLGRGKKAAVRYDHQDLDEYIAQGRHVLNASVRAAHEV